MSVNGRHVPGKNGPDKAIQVKRHGKYGRDSSSEHSQTAAMDF
jgi:hypothetical protein